MIAGAVYNLLSRSLGGCALVAVLGLGLGTAPRTATAQTDSTRSVSGIEVAGWLAGCWEASSLDGQNAAEEQWMAPRGGLMVGMSRTIRGGEARGYELATIRVDNDGRLIYHAEPAGQTPADFPARLVEHGRLEFVNAEHDFPQKIVYMRIAENSVDAAVFGDAAAAEPAFSISYRRASCGGNGTPSATPGT